MAVYFGLQKPACWTQRYSGCLYRQAKRLRFKEPFLNPHFDGGDEQKKGSEVGYLLLLLHMLVNYIWQFKFSFEALCLSLQLSFINYYNWYTVLT